jgi:hypothetical protein
MPILSRRILNLITTALLSCIFYFHIPQSFALDTSKSDLILQEAFQQQRSNIQVRGSGVVSRLLPDDMEGSRHQRFIVITQARQTLLISHNIDLAPRINDLREGDTIEFYGEYEWNNKGGVIHWTHLDPRNNHTNGWLKHKGKTYQ